MTRMANPLDRGGPLTLRWLEVRASTMANWSKNFERVFDQLFEEALPAHWRRAAGWQDAVVRDCGRHYEIEVAAAGVDPDELSVEVMGGEVIVRHGGKVIGRFGFPVPIDPGAVSARWSDGVLRIAAPKHPSRLVPVEKIR